MRKPKPRTSHHSHAFSVRTSSVERFTIRVHFTRDRPKPASAPYLKVLGYERGRGREKK